jgi:hypothetical protein
VSEERDADCPNSGAILLKSLTVLCAYPTPLFYVLVHPGS